MRHQKIRRTSRNAQEVSIGDGLKITLGELRVIPGGHWARRLAQQLDAERTRIADEQAKLATAGGSRQACGHSSKRLKGKLRQKRPPKPSDPSADWTKDPFFAPIAGASRQER